MTPGSWMPDGSALLFSQGGPGSTEIWVRPAGTASPAESKPWRLLPAITVVPQLSPDGRWIAYQAPESGTYQVYVRAFPGPGGQTQISIDGGSFPRWARSGNEFFYRNGDKMMAVEIETKPVFSAGRPKMLFEGRYEFPPTGRQPGVGYDVSPDGKRFLMIKGSNEQAGPVQLQVVHDWFEALKRRVPVNSK